MYSMYVCMHLHIITYIHIHKHTRMRVYIQHIYIHTCRCICRTDIAPMQLWLRRLGPPGFGLLDELLATM